MAGSRTLRPGETFVEERLWTPAEALQDYFAAVTIAAPPVENVPLAEATGRILAGNAIADGPYPADPRSTMDGFAVVASEGRARRQIVGEIRMGQPPPRAIGRGEALRIPTGGVLPDGADAVVPIEDVTEGAAAATIVLRERVESGENVSPAGSDMQPGDVVLRAGRRIGGPELAVLATLGMADVPVYRRPRVAIISTGDELVDPSARPGRGQIRDSNRWALAGSLIALGCVPVQRPTAIDTTDHLTEALRSALDAADAVVLTGGSSVGVRDLTPRVIDALGRPGVVVHGLRVKPGKPTVLAMLDGKPVVGLPGNPASSLMILEAIVAPVFSRLAGETASPPGEWTATAAEPFSGRPNWTWYIPVELHASGGQRRARPLPLRSANTSLLARAHGYAVVGPERYRIEAGEPLVVQRFSGGGRTVDVA